MKVDVTSKDEVEGEKNRRCTAHAKCGGRYNAGQ